MHEVLQHLIRSFRQRRTLFVTCFLVFFFLAIEIVIAYLRVVKFPLAWPLFVLCDLLLAFLCGWMLAQPLALHAYLREVGREQKKSRQLYTPLSGAKNLYETPTGSIAPKQQDIHLLVRQNAHLLILGMPGAGKTMALRAYQSLVLKYSWAMIWGRSKIPVYIPMKDYNVFLERAQPQQDDQKQALLYPPTLLAYLLEDSDASGMKHIRPYLERLARQGRLRFLCDGLNELDSHFQERVCGELVQTMRAGQNYLVMTCRELDYRERPALRQLVGKDAAEEALILPLKLEQMHDFIEKYTEQHAPVTRRHRYTAYEIMQQIEHTRLSYNCTNPLMLVNLIETIDTVGIDVDIKIGTRGRLLRKFVQQLIKRELARKATWRGLNEPTIMAFLGQVACSMRTHNRNGIRLGRGTQASTGSLARPIARSELAERLHVWLIGQPMPGVSQRPYTAAEVEQFLDFAQSAALVTISQNGVLSFRHELIAEFFAGYYLHYLDTSTQGTIPFGGQLVQDVGAWSEPVVIWAGMSDEPMELARRLANLHQPGDPARTYNALTLSLACVGVVWQPPHPTHPSAVLRLPDNVSQLLVAFAPDPDARSKLAAALKRCADEGGIEVYRSLLPLLMEAHIDDLLLEIDTQVIPDLLFDCLRDAVESNLPDSQLTRVVSILGRFGPRALPRAAELSQAGAHRHVRFQIAAIQILGYTGMEAAVGLIIPHLGAAEEEVRIAAVNALVHLGPGLALDRVIEELKAQIPQERIGKIHWSALAILRAFLLEERARLSAIQHQRILEALVRALSLLSLPSEQREAQNILARQVVAPADPADERWRRAITLLIRSLDEQDEARANAVLALLKQVGSPATPLLLAEFSTSRGEQVRVRLVDILGETRDPAALEPLLLALADVSPRVQEQVALALQRYAPKSIAHLITFIKTYQNVQVAGRAVPVLTRIGRESVDPVIQALDPSLPDRTPLLLDVLVAVCDPRAIEPLLNMLETLQNNLALAVVFIQAVGHFADESVVEELMRILLTWDAPAWGEAQKVLSRPEMQAFSRLFAALDEQRENSILQRVRATILQMAPFPHEQLLSMIEKASAAQVQQIELLLMQKQESAPVLVSHLLHPQDRVRETVHRVVEQLPQEWVTPSLLEGLQNPRYLQVITRFLLKYKANIPLLVGLLDDPYRSHAAVSVLLKFGVVILPSLIPALNHATSSAVRKRGRDLLELLVKQAPEGRERREVLTQIVELFASLEPESYGWLGLLEVLVSPEFSAQSIPVLLRGLASAPRLRAGCADVFVRLVRRRDEQSEQALQALLDALRMEGPRAGAANALVQLGEEMGNPVSEHIVASVSQRSVVLDPAIGATAQDILSRVGAPALAFVWSAYRDANDPALRNASQAIFRHMPTDKMKDRLLELLTSEKRLDVEMGLTLLLERIFVESDQPVSEQKMLPVLLDHVQTHRGERSTSRVVALLLLPGKEMVIEHLKQALLKQRAPWLAQVFLLLGMEGTQAQQALADMLRNPQMSQVHAEVAGVLGMLPGAEAQVEDLIARLSQYDFPPRPNSTNDLRQEISLRALGGVLASGHWGVRRLLDRWQRSQEGSPEQDLYAVLLGKKFGEEIGRLHEQIRGLEYQLQSNRADSDREIQSLHRRTQGLERKLHQKEDEIADTKSQITSLQQDKQGLERKLHQKEVEVAYAKNQITSLQQDKQRLTVELANIQQGPTSWPASS